MTICKSRARSILLLAFVVAACGAEPGGGAGNQAADSAPAPIEPPVAPPAPAPAPATKAPAVLAVEGEGVRLFDPETTSATPIPFGGKADEVLATLERLRGPAGRGTNQDCGAGPVQYANWPDGLSLVFQRDRFVGWGLDGRATGAIATASGIGPGSTRASLDAAYGDLKVSDSSLGVEFTAGGFSGVLDGPGASAKITDLWAGTSCVAR